MIDSPLRKVLAYFEDARQGVSINSIARDLQINPGQVESMVEFWVRKGRLQQVIPGRDGCGSCGLKGGCYIVKNLPRIYEFVLED